MTVRFRPYYTRMAVQAGFGGRRREPSVNELGAVVHGAEDVYGVRPTHGLVVLADGAREQVEFTRTFEQRLLAAMAEMRAFLCEDTEPVPRWVVRKCAACGYRKACWDVPSNAVLPGCSGYT